MHALYPDLHNNRSQAAGTDLCSPSSISHSFESPGDWAKGLGSQSPQRGFPGGSGLSKEALSTAYWSFPFLCPSPMCWGPGGGVSSQCSKNEGKASGCGGQGEGAGRTEGGWDGPGQPTPLLLLSSFIHHIPINTFCVPRSGTWVTEVNKIVLALGSLSYPLLEWHPGGGLPSLDPFSFFPL